MDLYQQEKVQNTQKQCREKSSKDDCNLNLYGDSDLLREYNIQSNIHMRPPFVSDRLYPEHQKFSSEITTARTSRKRAALVSDHDHDHFLDNGFIFSHCLYPPVSDQFRHGLIFIFAVCTTLLRVLIKNF